MAKLAKFLQGVAGAAGGAGLDVDEVFSTYVFEGNGSTQTITNGIDLAGEGGMVWGKSRGISVSHEIYDTERGVDKQLKPNSTDPEVVRATGTGGVYAFNSDGFSTNAVNSFFNYSGDPSVSWTFRKAPKFFDVVTYTGNLTARTISHNLDSVPGTIIIKKTSGSGSWYIYHRSLGNTAQLKFDNGSQDTGVSTWNSTTPTDTEFSLGAVSSVNRNGDSYVAYLFAHNDGDGDFGPTGDQDIIKCGSYTGNDSSGNQVDLGFEPQFVMVKGASTTGNWGIFDTMRGFTANAENQQALFANDSSDELSNGKLSVNSTGFALEEFDFNSSPETYIYIAIRRGPMAVPESATDVFDTTLDTTNALTT